MIGIVEVLGRAAVVVLTIYSAQQWLDYNNFTGNMYLPLVGILLILWCLIPFIKWVLKHD